MQTGSSVARLWDTLVILALIRGASNPQGIAGFDQGSEVSMKVGSGGTASSLSAELVEAAMTEMMTMFDVKNIPQMNGNRHAAFTSIAHGFLASSDRFANSFLGGSGSLAKGVVPEILGFKIMKTNQIPQVEVDADTTFGALQGGGGYGGDLSTIGTGSTANPIVNPTFGGFGEKGAKNNYLVDASDVVGVAWDPKAVVTAFWRRPEAWETFGDAGLNNYLDSVSLGTRQTQGIAPVYHGGCGKFTLDAS